MSERTLTVRLPTSLRDALDAFVDKHGLKMQTLVANAIADKLEELQDIRDSNDVIRRNDFVSLEDAKKELGI